jgi:hypothetical protein
MLLADGVTADSEALARPAQPGLANRIGPLDIALAPIVAAPSLDADKLSVLRSRLQK